MRIVLNPPTKDMVHLLSATLVANKMCPHHLGLNENRCNYLCIKCWNEAFENADGWIPVSQQEPYIDGKPMSNVLATMLDCNGGRFVTNTLDRNCTRENKVVAWQPLPEPSKS